MEIAAKRLLTLSNDNLNTRYAGTSMTATAQLEKMKGNDDQITGYREDLEELREEMGRLQQTLEAGRILYGQLEHKLEAMVPDQKEAGAALQEEVTAGKAALQ